MTPERLPCLSSAGVALLAAPSPYLPVPASLQVKAGGKQQQTHPSVSYPPRDVHPIALQTQLDGSKKLGATKYPQAVRRRQSTLRLSRAVREAATKQK